MTRHATFPEAAIASAAGRIRHVFLRDLVVSASVGVWSHEKGHPQRVRINLDLAVEIAKSSGAFGARMVGGGFGGSAIALIESAKISQTEEAITSGFRERGFALPRFFIATAEEGSRIEKS